tara:strand:- start:430 stop:1017 length:588 start_codon:yes stop_codon:yes gene_type:complete
MPQTRSARKAAREEQEAKESGLMGLYSAWMEANPFLSNQLQAALITAAAVYTSNLIAGSDNMVEIMVMTTVSLTFITPILLQYYGALNKIGLSLVPMLILDQGVFSPIFTFGILMWRGIVSEVIERKTIDAGLLVSASSMPAEIISILPGIMTKSWMFWIPIRLMILKFVPLQYHLVLGSAFSFAWQIILALALK